MCPPQTSCVLGSNMQRSPVTERDHVETAHAHSLPCVHRTPDLEQSGRHNTIQARPETEISP